MTQHNHFDHDFVEDSNTSKNPEFSQIVAKRMSRRTMLKGGTGLTAAAFFGTLPLVGCGSDNDSNTGSTGNGTSPAVPATGDLKTPKQLNFTAVAHYTGNEMLVADGYNAEAILQVGTPFMSGIEDWKDNREQTGESFQYRMGDNHDGMWFFGKNGEKYDPKSSNNALLVMNHEYTNETINPAGPFSTPNPDTTAPAIFKNIRKATDVRRECYAHGVSVVEMKRRANGIGYEMVKDSKFNKRYTSASEVKLSGPAAGSDLLKTKYDPTGTKTRGINNQCGAGLSPWGTYLTTEENFLNVFARGADKAIITAKEDSSRVRYGLPENGLGGGYLWHTPSKADEKFTDEFARWNSAATGGNALEDYRNAFNTFGYIVEIDPFNQSAMAVKRTALGRFAHENCAYAPVVEGKPVVMYMGDDARGEYIYKFVSDAKWSNADIGGGLKAGDKYLDKGTLYVAVFKDDGTGEWKALTHGQGALTNAYAKYAFADQADVLINARLAGDALGATKMDRPEWVSVSPVTGEVYVTLTNNSNRTPTKHGMNAANPRNYAGDKGNRNGHIIRWAEKGNDHTATSFNWDIYLFAAPNDLTAENLSGLNANNDLSSPDGLYFDPRGVLWIQTDDGAYTSKTNCMLLAALPGKVNDGKEVTTSAGIKTRVGMQANEQNIKRFFVGPKGCEVTGITLTPDFKTLFINIQHPGEDQPGVTWGAIAGGTTPRSATVMITKKDGGVILGESLT